MQKPIGLILAGGKSLRLFPESRPKPLLEINGVSLLEQTLDRLKNFETYVVTNQETGSQLDEALKKRGREVKFLYEPTGRDTAAAVGFGLSHFKDHPSWAAVLSADQWIPDSAKYEEFLNTVQNEVENYPESLFVAASPASQKSEDTHSRFGWVVSNQNSTSKSFGVEKFVEKPEGFALEEIRRAGGGINGGMFFGKIKTFIQAYEKLFPDPLDSSKNYASIERTPVDRAIFEKFDSVRSVSLDLQWEDLGTWQDWAKHTKGSPAEQVDAKNNFVYSNSDHKTFLFGVNDLAVIQVEDKTLVMPLSQTKDLKNYLAQVKT